MQPTLLAAAALAALLAGGCSQTDRYSGSAGYSGPSGNASSGVSAADDSSRSGVESSGGGVSIEPTPMYRRGMEPGTLSGSGRGAPLGEPGT
ncbi:MAG TPA: hypothetical protein VD995_03380 [Azospirillum sp.]|nr:hypothetical protein [Azospirillum sp.]